MVGHGSFTEAPHPLKGSETQAGKGYYIEEDRG